MRKMKFVQKAILFIAMVLTFASCTKVPAGYVGVKVYLLGGSKGVDSEVVGVGRYWVGMNEEMFKYPTYQINYVYSIK